MKQLLLTAFVLVIHAANAQSSNGSVKGIVKGDSIALEFASVGLLKTSFSATTGKNGHFIFKNVPAGKYQLKISYVGFENYQEEVEVTGGNETVIKAELIPLASKLKEIVVTGSFKEVTKLASVAPVEVYTTKYFKRNPSNNLWDALSNVNGIFPDVDNGISNTADIQINGLEGNYTMILIDGVPSMNGLAGVYALSALPMSMIDKIEIVRGASSTQYGSDAIAGVVNIITKNPSTAPILSVNAYLTSMLEANADITYALKLKKANSIFSASGVSSNHRWDIDGNGYTDEPLTNRASFYNKWNFNRKDNGITTVYGRFLFDDRFGGQTNTPGRDVGSDSLYTQWVRTYEWQAGFMYQLPVKEKVLLQADYSEHYQQAVFGIDHYSARQQSVFAQLTWNKKTDALNDLLMGVTYRMSYYSDNTPLSADSLTGGHATHIAGAFLEDELSIATGHKLIIGARFDYNNHAGPIVSPRLNYKWNSADEKNIVRIGAGTGYRTPNLLYSGFDVFSKGVQISVPEKLKNETAFTGNANYNRIQQLSGGLLNLDATLFYTYFINYIDADEDEPGVLTYSNIKGAMAPGFSLYGDFTFNYPLKIGVGFTYTHVLEVDEDDNGNKIFTRPPHSPDFTGNFFFSYSFPAPQLSLDWTGNIYSPMVLTTVPNDIRPGSSTWFTIQNIQVTKKFKKGVELYLGIKNIFNFVQPDPILRGFDPFNRTTNVNNPNDYRFDTTYGFTTTEGIKAFVGVRYTLP